MNGHTKGLDKIKKLLKNNGWKVIKNPENGTEDVRAQGVIYINFQKREKAIHLEFGDEDCVFND